jgi:hypothetical protein
VPRTRRGLSPRSRAARSPRYAQPHAGHPLPPPVPQPAEEDQGSGRPHRRRARRGPG